MANRITYGDKTGLVPKGVHANQWWDTDANEVKSEHNSLVDRVESLESNQLDGVERYDTYADLPVTGVTTTVYFVTNDPTPGNNGYWGWDGSVYVKGLSPYFGEVESGDVEAVEGGKIFSVSFANFASFCAGYNSSWIPKGFAKVGDATPTDTLNHVYRPLEDGTIFGQTIDDFEHQVLVGTGSTGYTVETLEDISFAKSRESLMIEKQTPLITRSLAYVTKTNTTVGYISGLGVSVYYKANAGDVFLYTGRYGQSGVAAIFLDKSGNILSYVEYTSGQIEVTDLAITAPANAYKVRFGSTSNTLLIKIKSQGDALLEVNTAAIEVNTAAIEVNTAAIEVNTAAIEVNANNISSNASAINDLALASIVNGVEFTTTQYLNVYSTVNGDGEIFMQNKVYENGFRMSELVVNIYELKNTELTDFDVRLYAVDESNKIIAVGDLINIPDVTLGAHTIAVNFDVPVKSRVALGVETGVSIGYNGTSDVGGFVYKYGMGADALDRSVGYIPTGTQSFSTACGFGYKATEYTVIKDKVNANTIAIAGFNANFASKFDNYLTGKKIVAIGDSMVQGHSLSDAAGQTWLAKLATRNNMTRVNYGINGTWLSDHDYGVYKGVVIRYVDMVNDADYILVFAGTNDAAGSATMGDDTSTDITTFKGALNVLCDGLITKYPGKKIGFITPYRRNSNYPQYVDAIKTICGKYGIPVFDNILNGGVCWTNAAQVAAITLSDTYHLNEAGMLYASYKYEAFVRSL